MATLNLSDLFTISSSLIMGDDMKIQRVELSTPVDVELTVLDDDMATLVDSDGTEYYEYTDLLTDDDDSAEIDPSGINPGFQESTQVSAPIAPIAPVAPSTPSKPKRVDVMIGKSLTDQKLVTAWLDRKYTGLVIIARKYGSSAHLNKWLDENRTALDLPGFTFETLNEKTPGNTTGRIGTYIKLNG